MCNCDKRGKKIFLQSMFNDLNNLGEDSDEEVRKDLVNMGIDLEKARKSFQTIMKQCQTSCKNCAKHG